MDEESFIWLLKDIQRILEKYARIQTARGDLTMPQAYILKYLMESPKQAVYAFEIHASCGVSKVMISTVLKELQTKGYVTLKQDQEDQRKRQITLTELGREVYPRAQKNILLHEKQLTEGLTDLEQDVMRKCLKQMKENIKKEVLI